MSEHEKQILSDMRKAIDELVGQIKVMQLTQTLEKLSLV